jgi:transcriptional regulator with XRE-family HTH domain
MTSWGRNVKAALLLADVPIENAARELNVSRKTLERTIRGEREPRPWETQRLAEVLGVPAQFLVEGLKTSRQPYATVADVAQYWAVSPRSVLGLCERWSKGQPGGLRYFRLGGARGPVRIHWTDVEAYGQAQRR